MRICEVSPGDGFGILTVLLVGRVESFKDAACICSCECGKVKAIRLYNLDRVRSCGCSRQSIRGPQKDIIKYHSVHNLLRSQRGQASGYVCVDCGDQAEEWSYDGGSPTETVQLVSDGRRNGKDRYVAHSGRDLSFYSPRCKKCHYQQDLERSRSNLS
jgi:hypothetical protein